MATPKQIISANIREERERRGITQSKAAEMADIPLRTYQRAEDSRLNTATATIAAIAKGFGIDQSTLYQGDEYPKSERPKSPAELRWELVSLISTLDNSKLQSAILVMTSLSGPSLEPLLQSIKEDEEEC